MAVYRYLTVGQGKGGWYGTNFVLLGDSYLDETGGFVLSENTESLTVPNHYLSGGGYSPAETYALRVDGSEIVFGQSNFPYSIFYSALSTGSEALGVLFYGNELDFANATGARKTITETPDIIEKDTIKICVTNGLNIERQFGGWADPEEEDEENGENGEIGDGTGSDIENGDDTELGDGTGEGGENGEEVEEKPHLIPEGIEYSWKGTQKNVSATGIRQGRNVTVKGDFNADIYAITGSNDDSKPYYISGWMVYKIKTESKQLSDGTTEIVESYYSESKDYTSDNTISAIGYEGQNSVLEVTGNISGLIHASVNNYVFDPVSTALIDNNIISAYGYSTTGMTVNGAWLGAGSVVSEVRNIQMILKQENLVQSIEKGTYPEDPEYKMYEDVASISNNTFASYAIYTGEGDFTVGDMGDHVAADDKMSYWLEDNLTISAKLENIVISNEYWYDRKNADKAPLAVNNTFNSFGIYTNNMTVNGSFNAYVEAITAGIEFNNDSRELEDEGGCLSTTAGIYAAGAIVANGTLGGSVNVVSQVKGIYNTKAYGIHADSIEITSGTLDSDVYVSLERIASNTFLGDLEWQWKTEGISVDTSITADAFTGNIVVSSESYADENFDKKTIVTLDNVGLRALEFKNYDDGIFDIAGNISVSGDYAVAISHSVVNDEGSQNMKSLNIRISGDVTAYGGVAVMSGEYRWDGKYMYIDEFIDSDKDANDYVEIAAGASVIGKMRLGLGSDTLRINSNAYFEGAIASTSTLNIEFVLDSTPFGGVAAEGTGAGIINTEKTLFDSTIHFTVDLNNAATGSYVLVSDVDEGTNWNDRTIDVIFGGINSTLLDEGYSFSTFEDDAKNFVSINENGLTGTLAVDGGFLFVKDANGNNIFQVSADLVKVGRYNQVVLTVDALPAFEDWATYFDGEITDMAFQLDRTTGVATLSWEDETTLIGTKYEVEYRYVTKKSNGSVEYSRSIVVTTAEKSLAIDSLAGNQTVEWRVRQVNNANVSEWQNFEGAPEEIYEFALDPVKNVEANLELSGQTAVSFLTWDACENASSGVGKYIVQYFQSQNVYTEEEAAALIDAGGVSYAEIEVTNNRAIVSGLRNTEYFYWRVQVEDNSGNLSDWSNGSAFRCFSNDTEAPFFTGEEPVSDVTWDKTHMDVTFTWSPAIDTLSGTKYYTISYRMINPPKVEESEGEDGEGTEEIDPVKKGEWITQTISVPQANASDYTLNLHLENGDYEWRFNVSDYFGNTSKDYTGIWDGPAPDTFAPVFARGVGSVASADTFYNPEEKTFVIRFDWQKAIDLEQILNEATGKMDPITCSGLSKYILTITANDYEKPEEEGEDVEAGGETGNKENAEDKNISIVFEFDADTTDFAWFVDEEYLKSIGCGPGSFSWSIAAVDNAKNENVFTSEEELVFSFDFEGEFTALPAPEIQAEHADIMVGIEGFMRIHTSASVTFDLSQNSFEDPVGGEITYRIQISDSPRFDSDSTYIFESNEPTLVLDGTVGSGSGALSGMERVYWRASAVDSLGNVSDWVNGTTFKFVDEEGYPIEDHALSIPSFVTNPRSIYRVDEETFERSLVLTWGGGDDTFGTAYYQIEVKDSTGKVSYFTVDNKEWTVEDVANGKCSWSVRAVDYTGKTSGWINGQDFVYDNVAPVMDNSSVSGTVYGSDLCITWDPAVDNVEMLGYAVVLQYIGEEDVDRAGKEYIYNIFNGKVVSSIYDTVISVGSGSGSGSGSSSGSGSDKDNKVEASANYAVLTIFDNNGVFEYIDVFETVGNSYCVSNLLDGNYLYTVIAVDKAGNCNTLSAESQHIVIDTTNEPGNSFGYAKDVVWNAGGYQNSVGSSSDRRDCYKLNLDSAAVVTITLRDVETLNDVKKAQLNVNLVDSTGKVIASYTVAAGKSSEYEVMLDPANGEYYLQISSATNKAVLSYVLETEKVDFPAATVNNTFSNAEVITLDAAGDAVKDGWVGFGDAADIYFFDAASAGVLDLTVSDVTSSVKVTLYDAGTLKKIKTLSVSSGSKTLSEILVNGDFYVEVVSGDKGKGKKNSEYTITVDNSYLPAASANNSLYEAEVVVLDANGDAVIGGWVGYGDAANCYKLVGTNNGVLSITVDGADAKIKVNLYDADMKKVKSVSLSSGSKTIDNIFAGDVSYVEIVSGDNGKGKQNTSFNVFVDQEYFPAATDNNEAAAATALSFIGDTIDQSGWVGFGDACDYYSFELTSACKVDLDLTSADMIVGKQVKIALYDADTGKKVAIDSDFISKSVLDAGTYLVSVECANTKKFYGSYDLSVAQIA